MGSGKIVVSTNKGRMGENMDVSESISIWNGAVESFFIKLSRLLSSILSGLDRGGRAVVVTVLFSMCSRDSVSQ